MKTLYLIPGTGADHRFFSRLQLDVKTQVIEWAEWGNAKTIHIHGSQDKVIPIKNINIPSVVNGGGHFMVYNMANEVGKVINRFLK